MFKVLNIRVTMHVPAYAIVILTVELHGVMQALIHKVGTFARKGICRVRYVHTDC